MEARPMGISSLPGSLPWARGIICPSAWAVMSLAGLARAQNRPD